MEVATQLGKVTTPIIMYAHMMAEGGLLEARHRQDIDKT